MFNNTVTPENQKSWCASCVGKHLARETGLCALQCADPYTYFRQANILILEKGRAPLLEERGLSWEERERERRRDGLPHKEEDATCSQGLPATCFVEQQRALQAPKREQGGLTLPGCEQVLGMQHGAAGLLLLGPRDCWVPICCLAMLPNKKQGEGFFPF